MGVKDRIIRREYALPLFKQGVVYLVFVILFTATSVYNCPGEIAYYQQKQIRSALFETDFKLSSSSIYITFNDIDSTSSLWDFLLGPFLDTLFSNAGYAPNIAYSGNVIGYNHILGLVQLKQVRVESGGCATPYTDLTMNPCYGSFSTSYEDRKPYGINNTWQWVDLGPNTYWARVNRYPESGYPIYLGQNITENRKQLLFLKNNAWITPATRAIFGDVAMYNPNTNMYSVVRMSIEFLPSGGVIPHASIRVIKLDMYAGIADKVMLGVECIVVIFTLVYVFLEMVKLIEDGPIAYFISGYNMLDWIRIGTIGAIIGVRVRMLLAFKSLNKDPGPTEYVNFQEVSQIVQNQQNFLSVAVSVTWWKMFKFLEVHADTSQLMRVLARAWGDIRTFLLMLGVVFCGFAVSGYIAFAPFLDGYRTLVQTFLSLLRGVTGDISFTSMYETNRLLGSAYFLFFFFFVFFLLLNMLLAIMNDSYYVIRSEKAISELSLSQLFWATFGQAKDVFAEQRMQEDEEAAAKSEEEQPTVEEKKGKKNEKGKNVANPARGEAEIRLLLSRMGVNSDEDARSAASEILTHFDIKNTGEIKRDELFLLKQSLLRKVQEKRQNRQMIALFDRLEDTQERVDEITQAMAHFYTKIYSKIGAINNNNGGKLANMLKQDPITLPPLLMGGGGSRRQQNARKNRRRGAEVPDMDSGGGGAGRRQRKSKKQADDDDGPVFVDMTSPLRKPAQLKLDADMAIA